MNLHEIEPDSQIHRLLHWLNTTRWPNQYKFKYENGVLFYDFFGRNGRNKWYPENLDFWTREWIAAGSP